DDALEGAEHLAVGIDRGGQARVQDGVGIGPGREDGRHQGTSTRTSAGSPSGRVRIALSERIWRSKDTGPSARRTTSTGIVSVAAGNNGPQPSDTVSAGSPSSPGPSTHFVHSCTSGGPPSAMRCSDGSKGRRNSVRFSSRGQRRTSSSIISVDWLVTVTT